MGGNGAGKSTLMKIIAGVETPDGGELSVEGQSYARLTPVQAHRLGIYLVPQEPLLFPNLTVRENILFRLPRDRDREKRLAEKLSSCSASSTSTPPPAPGSGGSADGGDPARINAQRRDPDPRRAHGLPHAGRNRTAVSSDPRPAGARRRDRFISHKLPEIRMLSSHVSVMRDGAVVLSGEAAQFDDNALIAAMTPVSREKSLSDTQSCGWRCRAIVAPSRRTFRCCGWRILPGKGLSISALRSTPGRSSAGRVGRLRAHRVCRNALWPAACARGRVWLENQDITAAPVSSRLDKGTVYLPEDRQVSGLFLDAAIRWNTVALNEPSLWQQRKESPRWWSAITGRWGSSSTMRIKPCARSPAATSRRCCWHAVWRPTRYC